MIIFLNPYHMRFGLLAIERSRQLRSALQHGVRIARSAHVHRQVIVHSLYAFYSHGTIQSSPGQYQRRVSCTPRISMHTSGDKAIFGLC